MSKHKETIIIELDFDTSDLTKEAAKSNQIIKELNESQKELKKNGEEGSIQFQKNSEALRENKKELRETNKNIDQLNSANKATAGSNEQLRAQLSILTKEYNGLSEAERENGARGQELNAQINQTTDTLKENEEGIGDNRRSVGDYGKALGQTPFGSFIGGIKSMGAAFLANPIGLIVTAIVLALKALFEAFKSTEEGEDKVAKATAIIGTIFSKLFDVLEPLAGFLVDVLGAAFDFIIDQVNKAADGIEAALEFFGFEGASEGLKEYRSELALVAKGAALVADARAKAEKIERALIVENAKGQRAIAEARGQVNDVENVSAADRKKALEEAATLTDDLAAKQEKAATLRLKALQLENGLTNSNKEALNAEAEAEAELINIQTQRANLQKGLLADRKKVNAEIAKANKDAIKAAQDIQKAEIASQKIQLSTFIENQGIRAKTLEEQLKISEQVAAKELEILEKQLAAKLISEEQFNLAKLELQNEQLLMQAEAVAENAQRELDLIIEANSQKLEANQFLTDELFIQEQEKNARILEAQLEFEALRLEQGLITEQEFQDAVRGIKEENAEIDAALAEEKAAADEEQRIVDLENQREIDLLNREDEFALRQADLDRQKAQELANAEATGADKALIEEKFSKFSTKIEKEQRKAQVGEALQAFDAIAGLAAGNAEAAKAIAIAQAIINGFQGVTAVLSAQSVIPEPFGTVLKGITAVAIGATALINVNKIRSTPVPKKKTPKAAKGGIFGGNSHARGGNTGYFQDGTVVEVEAGEMFAVLNKNSTGMIQGMSNLNEAGGGVSFGKGGTKSFLQDGGIAIDNVSSQIDGEIEQSLQIVAAVEALPPPVVLVQDINEVQGETIEVEQRAIV
jgi:hypothetical protein